MSGVETAPARAARHRRVRLVVGPPGTGGIQEALVAEVRRLKEGDPLRPVTILVGSNYLRAHLSRHLAIRLGGHAGIRFALLKDLARELGPAPLLARGRRALPEFGRDLLLEEVVAAHSHGTYFREIAQREGFLEALGATLRDLKEAAIDPAALRAAAAVRRKGGLREAADEVSAGKLEDLAVLFEAYDDRLRDRRYYDEEDLMKSAIARAAVGEGAQGEERHDTSVIVYGFYDATWSQRQLIHEYLAFRAGVVFFPYEPSDADGSYDYADPMLAWLASWIRQREDLAGPRGGRAPDVTILSAPGEVREAVEATRWLLGRARAGSLPFGELGLVYRSSEPYLGTLSQVMTQAGGVPRFLADGAPLAAAPAARALQLMLRAREEGYPRRSMIELLALTARDEATALWDRISRDAGVVKGIADWRRKLEAAAPRPGVGRHARELLARVEDLHGALEALPRRGSWHDLAQAVIDRVHRFVPDDPSVAAVEDRLAALGALDEVSTPVGIDRFAALLKRALEEAPLRAESEGQFQRSGIFVGNVMDARLLSFHALAVVGLVEKSFPTLPRQDPILLDEEREVVNRVLGADRLPLKARRGEEERLLFRLACASATESLLLSYPRLDPATARPRIPSTFLLRAARRLEGRPVDYEGLERLERTKRVSLGALAPKEPGAAIVSREFDLCVLRAASGASARDPAARRRAASWLHANPMLHRALEAEEARWGEPRFTAHDGVILRPNVLDALRTAHPVRATPLSASRIESYATCPLAYFMSEVLELEALDEPEEYRRLDPMRRGSLVHRILFDLFTTLRSRGELPITAEREAVALATLREVAARCFAQEEKSGMTGLPMLWHLDMEQILDDLAQVVAAEALPAPEESGAGWRPRHFEIRYGMEPRTPGAGAAAGAVEDPASTAEPVLFEIAPGRAIQLKGQIDRIDVSADGAAARVTDYKTGRMDRYRNDSLSGGTSVQLPLYMVAAEKLLAPANPGLRAGEARYLSVDRKGRFRSVTFSAGALEERRADLARILATFVNGVARGVFFAYPVAAVCQRCDFRLACGEGRETRFARKRQDATAADFVKMRETPS